MDALSGREEDKARWPWSRRPQAPRAPAGYISYGPLYDPEPEADDLALGSWHGEPPEPGARGPRTRGWWIRRGLLAALAGLVLIVLWLAITAPLSKSLQPIAPPQLTLLAADGTPIARNGAEIEAPVKVRELPPHVVQALLAIEDRRFYDALRAAARSPSSSPSSRSSRRSRT
jgi:penicillin-binding protein 1A